jgi:prepilin peptidase CpaA
MRSRELMALALASLLSALLLWTGKNEPLPALGWATAFLFLVTFQDTCTMRISNRITLPALAGAVVLKTALGGWPGMLSALLGAGAALALLWIPFVVRWLGAGDIKALMVLGALWGAGLLLPVLWWIIVVGGLLALAQITVAGGLIDLLRRWTLTLWTSLQMRSWYYFGPDSDSPASQGIPFAIAMVLGACAHQFWGLPWK